MNKKYEKIGRGIANKLRMEDLQLKRFHSKYKNNLESFIDKVIVKYNNDNYKNRYLKRNIDPPLDLYWFLFEYAAKYGRNATKDELEKYGNCFTDSMFFINGFLFHKMNGQGSSISIIKAIDYWKWISKKVCKISGKPFLNGLKILTVKNICINVKSEKMAFVMEDYSIIDCFKCKLI